MIFLESASVARKDSIPPVDGQKGHGVDMNTYSQEQIGHDMAPSSSMLQGKDDGNNSEQVPSSFGDMNISVQAIGN